MKRIIVNLAIMALISYTVYSQGYSIGDNAGDFKLKNIDDTYVSMSQFTDAKGFVVIFTCNHCPFAKAYQDRIITLDKKYKSKGYPVIAINPNDPEIVPEDSFEHMKECAKDKGFTFPYLFDEKQEVYKAFGATRTPHVFLLQKESKDLIVRYIGAIDDNYKDATAVSQPFLSDAIDAILQEKKPDPNFTKAIGCTIKTKSK